MSASFAPPAAGRLLAWPAVAAAVAVAAPVIAVVLQAFSAGAPGTLAHLASTVLPRFALASLQLSASVLAIVLVVGVGCAWLVAACEFPFRRLLMPALVLPLAVPAFVMAYAYTDAFDTIGPIRAALASLTGGWIGGPGRWFEIRSIGGASAMLGLALYPYVFMLARVAFAERSAALAEAARGLGLSGLALWWRVTLPVARPAIVAGCALVLMETLADFGAVSYFAVDTLSAGIYRAWQGLGDPIAAARLALVLLASVGLLAWVERRSRSRIAYHMRSARTPERVRLAGPAGVAAAVFCALPVLAGFVVPVALLLRAAWVADASVDARLFEWTLNSALLGGAGAVATVAVSLLSAYAVRLAPGRWSAWASAVACGGYALPGVVIGVGMLAILSHVDRIGAGWLRGTILVVVWAYGVRFFAVAFQTVEAGLKRISPSMDASARSLGASPAEVLARVHWPLLRPSTAAASLLVFVDSLKELPATLVLRPFDFDTLAVVAYHFASDERLAMAAAPSLVIVLVALVPTAWLAARMARQAR